MSVSSHFLNFFSFLSFILLCPSSKQGCGSDLLPLIELTNFCFSFRRGQNQGTSQLPAINKFNCSQSFVVLSCTLLTFDCIRILTNCITPSHQFLSFTLQLWLLTTGSNFELRNHPKSLHPDLPSQPPSSIPFPTHQSNQDKSTQSSLNEEKSPRNSRILKNASGTSKSGPSPRHNNGPISSIQVNRSLERKGFDVSYLPVEPTAGRVYLPTLLEPSSLVQGQTEMQKCSLWWGIFAIVLKEIVCWSFLLIVVILSFYYVHSK